MSDQNKSIILLEITKEKYDWEKKFGILDVEKWYKVLNVEEGAEEVEESHLIGAHTERVRVPVVPSSRTL